MKTQRHEQSNEFAIRRISTILTLPYIGYWCSSTFADGIAHEIYWKLVVSFLAVLFSILVSISNCILAIRHDLRKDTVVMIMLCGCGLAYGIYGYATTLDTLVPLDKELFNFALICYFAVNGSILFFSLVNSFMVKRNLVANDFKY
jgi:hypothetical protein